MIPTCVSLSIGTPLTVSSITGDDKLPPVRTTHRLSWELRILLDIFLLSPAFPIHSMVLVIIACSSTRHRKSPSIYAWRTRHQMFVRVLGFEKVFGLYAAYIVNTTHLTTVITGVALNIGGTKFRAYSRKQHRCFLTKKIPCNLLTLQALALPLGHLHRQCSLVHGSAA